MTCEAAEGVRIIYKGLFCDLAKVRMQRLFILISISFFMIANFVTEKTEKECKNIA